MKKVFVILTLVITLLFGNNVFARGEWTSARDMSTARANHTATLLNNGKVLVTGGEDRNTTVYKSTEIYDPVSDTWERAEDMLKARTMHTATLLKNGKVLVVGGHSNVISNITAEVYDPDKNTWHLTGKMSNARVFHTATLLQNGKVLVAGGIADKNAQVTAEIYDPETNTWSPAGEMTINRSNHTATLLNDGRVLVTGGYIYNGTETIILKTAELYNPITNSWSLAADMSEARDLHTAVLLQNGKVLILAGEGNDGKGLKTAEIYNPENNTWTQVAELKTARIEPLSALLLNGAVLVAGGYDYRVNTIQNSEIYSPNSNTWIVDGYLGNSRDYNTMTLLQNGKVLITGGVDDLFASLRSTEIFNPRADFRQYEQKVDNTVILNIESPIAYVNGYESAIDYTNSSVYPLIKDERTLVPIRFISEGFGATVDWDDLTKTATISSKDGRQVKMTINSKIIKVNGVEKIIDVPTQIINERTFIPLRALVEALGKQVYWDDRYIIIISDNDNTFEKERDKDLIDMIYENRAYELMDKETIGALTLGLTDKEVINILGQPDEKSETRISQIDGAEHQQWTYSKKGIGMDMSKCEGQQYISFLSVGSPYDYKTSKNIGIGSTRNEVINAYKYEYREEFLDPNDENLIFGSVYGGVLFKFENGKVSDISIGAFAE